MQKNLTVNANSNIKGNLEVEKDTHLNANLYVKDTIYTNQIKSSNNYTLIGTDNQKQIYIGENSIILQTSTNTPQKKDIISSKVGKIQIGTKQTDRLDIVGNVHISGTVTAPSLYSNSMTSLSGQNIIKHDDKTNTIYIGEKSLIINGANTKEGKGTDIISSASGKIQIGKKASDTLIVSGDMTVNGVLYAKMMKDEKGHSVIRKENDGSIHIGVHSFVFKEEANKDIFSSSSGNLVIGNNKNHTTTIVGHLIVDRPTAPNHAANKAYVDEQILNTKKEAYKGIATSMAIGMLPEARSGKSNIGIGVGTYKGENALAAGLSISTDNNIKMKFATSISGGDISFAASFGWEF